MVPYGFTATSLLEDNRVQGEDVVQMKKWITDEENIPELSDEQLCLFLIACNNKVEFTKKCILDYYTVRKNGPELFNNRNPYQEDIQCQLKVIQLCILPKRTENNCVIIIHRLQDPIVSNYDMEVAMKLLFMTFDASLYENPPDGLIMLFDMDKVGIMHLSRLRLNAVKIFFTYLQEALPIKLKEIHVFNVVWFFDKIMNIIKPFMKKELMHKLFLHTSSINMEEFYQKYVPKSVLPSDFGGELSSIEENHTKTCLELMKLKDHFYEEEQQRKTILTNSP